ncbi:hypothetical protein CBS101457_002277 [Exobasidium rhododendri]|nr:hypothetical protein CBS101457_002277 [Exobasidium rhododendri]
MEEDAPAICYSIPADPQIPSLPSKLKHQLHGADDLITLFDLKPLWEERVRPYAKQTERNNYVKGAGKDDTAMEESNEKREEAGSLPGSEPVKSLLMEKTYINYVRDLPGQVRPPKRTVSRYQTAMVAASSSGAPMPTLPHELTGRTTMRDIVFRPETTVQRIAPFDEESLRSAFTVEAGPVAEVRRDDT